MSYMPRRRQVRLLIRDQLRILVQKSLPKVPDLDLYRYMEPQVVTSLLSKVFVDLLQGEPAGDNYTHMVLVAKSHFYAMTLRAI